MTDLTAERDRIIADLDALKLPPKAAAVVREADALIAEHQAKVAALVARRDEIDELFQVSAASRREIAAKERADYQAQLRRDLIAAEEERLGHVADAERHLRAFVESLNAAFASHARVREIANTIAAGLSAAKTLQNMSAPEFVSRIGGRMAGLLATIQVPGTSKGAVNRIGGVSFLGQGLYPADQDWRAKEEALTAESIAMLVNHTKE